MKQYQAGFILDNLIDVFEHKSQKQSDYKQLAKWVSIFQVNSKTRFEEQSISYQPIIAVLINLLQRGLPTRLNKHALETIINNSKLFAFSEKDSVIELQIHSLTNDEVKKETKDWIKETLFNAIHLIEPRIRKADYQNSWEKLGSEYEEDFLYHKLPISFGKAINNNGDFIVQLLAPQRKISSIIKDATSLKDLSNTILNNFDQQRTDFSIEFPYNSTNKTKGLVIEIDGSQHENSSQAYLDTERDKAVALSQWNNTLRIKTSEFNTSGFDVKINEKFWVSIANDYIVNSFYNFRDPFWNTPVRYELFQVTLIPFAIARFQRMLIEAIAHKQLDLNQDVWKIAVLERDVPFAKLAIDDFVKLLDSINALTDCKLILPEIDLHVFNTQEFVDSQFKFCDTKLIVEFDSSEFFDLVFDVAILERSVCPNIILANSPEIISIRSIHYVDSQRTVATSDLIRYNPISARKTDDKWEDDIECKENLQYLLQSIFRKKEFRHGQIPIMHNALQCKSVIGLLPTGGGKSLTYQLSALLQPGVCLVIDPIKSLMKDQVDGLLKNNIDSCAFINSTLKGEEKRKAIELFKSGHVQFVFVSPERLQMEDFRLALQDMANNNIFFSYCVIDEAHCVSEWGHDFRTAFLRLGENAMKFCKTKNLENIPLFGLTATASYDVLADVQRELSGNSEAKRLTEESIVRAEYSQRDELQFLIEEVTISKHTYSDIWDLKNELGTEKQKRLKSLSSRIPIKISEFQNNPLEIFSQEKWDSNDSETKNMSRNSFELMQIHGYQPTEIYKKNGALIFCPHKSGVFGVTDMYKVDRNGNPVTPRLGYYDLLSENQNVTSGYFMGGGEEVGDEKDSIEQKILDNQDKFINNEIDIMVATKAFGMGIDKENIRYTVHVNYPSSIESFVQEAGRAGRDRKIALSYILFNDQEVQLLDGKTINHDLEINKYFHNNSFKGTSKELAVIDELLTEIYFPDRTFEIENQIEIELGLEVQCNYWERENHKRIYINKAFNESFCYIDLTNLSCNYIGTINKNIAESLYNIVRNYISATATRPYFEWILKSDRSFGIERMLKNKKDGDDFKLIIGFFNNTKERVKSLSNWLKENIHNYFDEVKVRKMKSNATDSIAFIEEVCNQFSVFSHGQTLDFIAKCRQIDMKNGCISGTTIVYFQNLFDGYRDKSDTEKAIYRLLTLGIIDDYMVNFSSHTFTIMGTKKSDKEYVSNLKSYLLKYYSEKTALQKMQKINTINEPTLMRKLLRFLVEFVYSEIAKKRIQGLSDMKYACRVGVENGPIELKEFIDLYFNSKYARSGYIVNNKNASLYDLLIGDEKTDDKIDYVWYFIGLMDIESTQIENYKHLRGATTRLLRVQPDSYTLLMLNAYALYMLEFKNQRYIDEAEALLLRAFTSIQENEPEIAEEDMEKILEALKAKILEKNGYLSDYFSTLTIDSFLLSRYLKILQKANSTIQSINKKLN